MSRLVRLTRPDGSAIFIRPDAISAILPASKHAAAAGSQTEIVIGGLRLFIKESIDTVVQMIIGEPS
jgi:hypothetical protein